MQSLRTTIQRAPKHLNRITKHTAPTAIAKRHISHTPSTMALFPRFTQEFAPMFRLFDEFDRQSLRNLDQSFKSLNSFTPKFDVKETKDNYELHGELPGVDQKNIDIQWTDNNTLTISGRHEHVREEGERQGFIEDATAADQGKEKEKDKEHQPTVEDETDANANNTQVAKQSQQKDVVKDDNRPKYWVSERSVGEFHRSFAFPARVDQDAVKASLKNGILSIVVPKAKAPLARKINIE